MLESRSILLTIAIPTYNRYRYLRELVPELLTQCDDIDPEKNIIEVLFSDNFSTDETSSYLQSIESSRVVYKRNEKNIGADANFIECVKRAKGKFVWLFGDDELLCSNSIANVINILKNYEIALLITESAIPESSYFNSYRDALNSCLAKDKLFPLIHTLITSNIFLKNVFDINQAYNKLNTNYGHMYAIIKNLSSGGVYVCGKNQKIIQIRKERAEFADEVVNLEAKLIDYVYHVGDTFDCFKVKLNVWFFYKIKNSRQYNSFRVCRKKLGTFMKFVLKR